MRIPYVDIDFLHADHLGCYGYFRSTGRGFTRRWGREPWVVLVVSADHGTRLRELNVYGDHRGGDVATVIALSCRRRLPIHASELAS